MANAVGNTREEQVAFISGFNADGTLAAQSFATYNRDNPDTYGTLSGQFHWGPDGRAGTGGGALSYFFDPSANWTAGEQASLISSLDMWSAVADISFQQTNSGTGANLTFTRNATTDAFASSSSFRHAVGSDVVAPPVDNKVLISMDIGETQTATGGHGSLGDFQNGGGGVSTVLHEVGHALGLGHGGPYNGANALSQQYGPYDNKISSLMSYFHPNAATAYPSPIGTTDWVSGNIGYYPTSWMPVDIDAIQRLYGAQTNGQLNTAQTFGYNTTVTGGLQPYFDFTVNTRPVVTLYGTAVSGNTIDLSGSNQAATLNLNGGTYSSAFGMTNNIAIYDRTYIQNARLGAGDDTVTMGVARDSTADGGAGTNTARFSGNSTDYAISRLNGLTTVTRTGNSGSSAQPVGVASSLENFQTLQFDDQAVAVCYGSGTRLRVVRDGAVAEIAVENLRVGDHVVTASGAHRPIRWLGHRHVDCTRHPKPVNVWPVRIAAGALGDNRPVRDLFVSPGHAICLDLLGEVLVLAMSLVNGSTITQDPVAAVTYWHVELDAHDILMAENLPAESYLDCGNRAFFANACVTDLTVSPDARPSPAAYCRPLHGGGPLVDLARARLRDRAEAAGWTLTEAPLADLHLVADGAVIHPDVDGLTARFVLPAGARAVRLISGVSAPAHVDAEATDLRRLGLSLGALTIDDGLTGARTIALDDARLETGFHPAERNAAEALWRWTDGDALLPSALWDGCRGTVFLCLTLTQAALPRWVPPGEAAGAVDRTEVRRHA